MHAVVSAALTFAFLAATDTADQAEVPDAQAGSLYPFMQAIAEKTDHDLSFLSGRFNDLEEWKTQARSRVFELLQYDPPKVDFNAEVVERVDCGQYTREKVHFNTTPEIRVPAYVLIPQGEGPFPAVVALHDHGAFFVWGKEKVVDLPEEHPSLAEFKSTYYSGRSWATELAKRGYVVIAIDMFYWGERRLLLRDDPPSYFDRMSMTADEVLAFNRRSSEKTWMTGVGLWKAGISWAGVMLMDDIRTVDYLASRPEVDPERIGCCGLSVGGFRSAHLVGLDPRIRAGVVVGWMCTYGDMLKNHLTSIGPMKIYPGLYGHMDLPDIASMNCPGGLMIIQGTEDLLFPLDGVHAAYDRISAVYEKAGYPDRFRGVTYEGPHEFNAEMQQKAFDWLDRWLKQ